MSINQIENRIIEKSKVQTQKTDQKQIVRFQKLENSTFVMQFRFPLKNNRKNQPKLKFTVQFQKIEKQAFAMHPANRPEPLYHSKNFH